MIRQAASRLWAFAWGEVVLSVAVILAVISAFFVPPNLGYLSYIDWDTLALLFSLMAVMKGFQQEGLFEYVASALLQRTATTRSMMAVLVFLPFFCSMVITNDVSLITFVPFAIAVLRLARQETLVVPLIAMQTLAANLGSMLTPMGNPQNLYLYSRSGMGFLELCGVLLPYVVFSGICLLGMVALRRPQPVPRLQVKASLGSGKNLAWCTGGLLLCLCPAQDVQGSVQHGAGQHPGHLGPPVRGHLQGEGGGHPPQHGFGKQGGSGQGHGKGDHQQPRQKQRLGQPAPGGEKQGCQGDEQGQPPIAGGKGVGHHRDQPLPGESMIWQPTTPAALQPNPMDMVSACLPQAPQP